MSDLCCYFYLKAGNLVKQATFYISLAYGTAFHKLGIRDWYNRISDNMILGALPILPQWDNIQLQERVTHVISMVESFESEPAFVLGPTEAAERGLAYLSLPVEDFIGVPSVDQVSVLALMSVLACFILSDEILHNFQL